MNPLFIISDTKVITKNTKNKYYGYYDESSGDILSQYRSFRSSNFKAADLDNEIYNGEIILIYLRDIRSPEFNKHESAINKLTKDITFKNDVLSIFYIDIFDELSNYLSNESKNKIKEINTKILAKTNADFINIIFSKENAINKEFYINEVYHQIENLLFILHSSYHKVYSYFTTSKKSSFYQNAFGSSKVIFAEKEIEESIYYLNNTSQLLSILNNEKLNKDMLDNIIAKIPAIDDKAKIQKLLSEEYSKSPDEVNVINSVNGLYQDCDIDNITNTFDSIDSFPFSDYISNNDKVSISTIDSSHSNYLFDIIHRTTNSITETETFFETSDILFREYRNNKIIGIQKDLNKQKKDKKRDIIKIIENYSTKVISQDYADLVADFGETTSFEALKDSLNYFAFGSDNDQCEHDKNIFEKIKSISTQSNIERAIFRRDLFKSFHDTKIQLKERIESIDNILEDNTSKTTFANKDLQENNITEEDFKINNEEPTGYRKLIDQRKQLSFSFIDKSARLLDKHRYSFLQRITFFSFLTSIVLFGSSFYIFSFLGIIKAFKVSLFFGLAPIIVGGIFIIIKVLKYKKYKKYLESLITQKVALLNDVISNHDTFVKHYISQIKTEYTLEILKDTQRYCQLKAYKINNFRKYLINHFIYSIQKYQAINFDTSVFDYSLITKKRFEDYFFEHSLTSYFLSEPENKLRLFELYINKSKTDKVYEYLPPKLNIDFFNENEIAYDKVDALEEHKSIASYHNKFLKKPILYLSSDNNSNPIILEDINQGQVGNCYFMASIGAIAQANPSYIRKMIAPFNQSDEIVEEKEGNLIEQSFLIRFFDEESNERFVAVDNKFWFHKDSQDPIYAKYGFENDDYLEIWPMIIEKAWAKVNNGYNNIVGSNSVQRKLDFGIALSGNSIDYKDLNDFKHDADLITFISDNIRNNTPIVIYSNNKPEDSNVVGFHAYTIKDIESDKINIYNPHGDNHLLKKTVGFIRANFETLLFFNLSETTALNIPVAERVKYIDHILEIEETLRSFLGDDLSKSIKNLAMSEIIDNEELKQVMLRIDNSSSPLFNNIDIENDYSVLFTDIQDIDLNSLKKLPNETNPKNSEDIYLLLTKFISWKI